MNQKKKKTCLGYVALLNTEVTNVQLTFVDLFHFHYNQLRAQSHVGINPKYLTLLNQNYPHGRT